jgi:hypothetical protein
MLKITSAQNVNPKSIFVHVEGVRVLLVYHRSVAGSVK